MRRWAIAGLLAAGIAWLAYWRRTLTRDGAVASAIVGCVVFARGGLPGAVTSLAFFISSSALSRLGEGRKQALPLAQAKGARRDAWQVAANGAVATLCIGLGRPAGFVGALAAAGADTWATEVGLLANGPPRLITTLELVPAGTSGGVTGEGLAASLGGALVVGTAWAALGGGGTRAVGAAAIAGLTASIADSLIGATLQALYHCAACDAFIESSVHRACGAPARLVRGLRWMTNDAVNGLATLVGAAVSTLLWKKPNAAGHVRGGG